MSSSAAKRDRGRAPLNGTARMVAHHGFLGAFLLSLGVTAVALQIDFSPTLATIAALIPIAIARAILERCLPYSEQWRPNKATRTIDLTHSIVWPLLLTPRVQSICLVLVVWLGEHASMGSSLWLWPSSLPRWVQFLLAVLLADFIAYWFHRLLHSRRSGWRIHAVHHSSTRLHFLSAGRSHPLNFLFFGIESFVLLALGVGPDVLALVSTAKGAIGLVQHANIDLRPGWLSRLVATNEVHFWHHSVHREESDRNFGNVTMVWDQIFGTFYLPETKSAGTMLGIENARVPERFLTHLLLPFRLQRYELQPDEARR